MRLFLSILVAFMVLFVLHATASADSHATKCRIAWWDDGDTVVVRCDGVKYGMRLEAINVGQGQECGVADALAWLRRNAPKDTVVWVRQEGYKAFDDWGRNLRAMYLDSGLTINVAEKLIRKGWAVFPTQYADHPRADYYQAAEDYARQNDLGMWGPSYCGWRDKPWGYRK